MYINKSLLLSVLIAICCFIAETTSLFNNAIGSPFSNPLQSPFGSSLGLGFSNNIGIRQGSPFSPFGQFGGNNGINNGINHGINNGINNGIKRRCPVCDSSVYDYCSEKLFHDSCCCHNPNNPYDQLPYQCEFADCSFLHANSCREHKLITACCCTNFLVYRK